MKKHIGTAVSAWIAGTFYEIGRKHGKAAADLGPGTIGGKLTAGRKLLADILERVADTAKRFDNAA